MQTTLFHFPKDMDELEITRTINVVILFEDIAAGKRAKKIYDCLVLHLKDFEFDYEVWKFDILENAKLQELAASDAAAADIIIIAMHGDTEFPAHIKAWFDLWVGQNGNPMALVVLYDVYPTETSAPARTRGYLESVAQRGNMDFFVQPDGPADGSGQIKSESAETDSSRAELSVFNTPGTRWNIT